MKAILRNAVLTTLFCLLGTFTTLASTNIEPPDDCHLCGMNRTAFAHSRTLIEYEDGSSLGTCSINCAVITLQSNPDKKVKRLDVADYNSKKLIDAKKAFWVIGGSKRGVMTSTPKWAFTQKKSADEFISLFGGRPAAFDDVRKAVEKELK